ncbi:MAG TPA: hypothetical protein VEB86_11850 [Chryseosolibacter sp.]|nr:hypothetical protein [Chryseosolibacter sp.]
MKRTLLFIFLVAQTYCFAQLKGFSVQTGTNFPLIPQLEHTSQVTALSPTTGYTSIIVNAGELRESYEGQPGFYAQTNWNHQISSRFFMSVGAGYDLLRFKRAVEVVRIEEVVLTPVMPVPGQTGTPYGVIYAGDWDRSEEGMVFIGRPADPNMGSDDNRVGRTTANYLKTRLLAGTSFYYGRVAVKAGFTASYLLSAHSYQWHYETVLTPSTGGFSSQMSVIRANITQGMSRINAGAVLEASLYATKNIGIDFSATHHVTPLYTSEMQSAGKAKLNTLSFGVSYRF